VIKSPRRKQTATHKQKMKTIQDNDKALSDVLNFALAHDWGAGAVMDSDAICICDDISGETVKFADMRTIKAWGGY